MPRNAEAAKNVKDAITESVNDPESQALIAEMRTEAEAQDDALVAKTLEDFNVPGPSESNSETTQNDAEGEGPSDIDAKPETAQAETQEGTAEEPPTEYFGVDLSDLPSEKRAEIVDRLKAQDKFANRLMQRNAELEKQSQTPEATEPSRSEPPVQVEEPFEPPSVDDVLANLGYDPGDPNYDIVKDIAGPLAAQLAQVSGELQSLREERELQQTVDYWNSSLDALEGQYGQLPVDRERVLDFAVERNIFDPTTAYHSFMAPLQREVQDEAAKARREALENLKRQQQGAVRPVSSQPSRSKPIKGMKVKDAMKLAVKEAQDELGYSFRDAHKEAFPGEYE